MLKAAQSGNSVGAGAQYNIGRAFYQVSDYIYLVTHADLSRLMRTGYD